MNLSHRANLIEILRNDLLARAENVAADHQAFVRLAAEWLGYFDLDEERHFVDGAGDRGIDFWYASDSAFELFQIKSHELTELGEIQTHPFDSQGVQDLQRAVNFLTDENPAGITNPKLKELRRSWDYIIGTQRLAESKEDDLQVTLALVLFGDGLTSPANQELDSLISSLRDAQQYRDVSVKFRIILHKLDDIIMARWREDNREWRDKSGKRRDRIALQPRHHQNVPQYIPGVHNTVFYCKAIDLVTAFEDFGYQLFEPNVRAHIRRSRVNDAIINSLKHSTSRKEFQFLNNGITITCKSYSKPSENNPSFRIIEPGIVNGLQTVVSIHEAYFKLDAEEKEHLEENCFVLVRLLSGKAVRDLNKVVVASNTQNPMQARNLRSNTSEQIFYERLFAELGWFYERKQGAWNAFSSDPSRWRSLPNYRKRNFQTDPEGRGRPKYRIVDNELIAQTWLSFIGFSDDAVHKKRFIFDEDDWYNLAFLHRTRVHASEYGFRLTQAQEDWKDEASSPSLMLVSYISRELAKQASLSSRENLELTCRRLDIDQKTTPKEELENKLVRDEDYLLEQVISGMSFVFVEFFGYLLYHALGSKIHDSGRQLLENRSLKYLKETGDLESVVSKARQQKIEAGDLLLIAWFAFRHTIHQLMAGPWKQSYQTARNRSRFNHSVDTRTRIYKQVNELDKFMEKSQLTQVWAANIPSQTGLFQYFRNILSANS